jgi:serine/threonine protein kinase
MWDVARAGRHTFHNDSSLHVKTACNWTWLWVSTSNATLWVGRALQLHVPVVLGLRTMYCNEVYNYTSGIDSNSSLIWERIRCFLLNCQLSVSRRVSLCNCTVVEFNTHTSIHWPPVTWRVLKKKRGLFIIVVVITYTDFLEGGTLFDLPDEKKALSEAETRFYASEIVLALEHLHKVGAQSRCSCPGELRNEAIQIAVLHFIFRSTWRIKCRAADF